MLESYNKETGRLKFLAGTDIKDAVEIALEKCIQDKNQVSFRFNGVEMGLDYTIISKSIIFNEVYHYTRTLQSLAKKEKEEHESKKGKKTSSATS